MTNVEHKKNFVKIKVKTDYQKSELLLKTIALLYKDDSIELRKTLNTYVWLGGSLPSATLHVRKTAVYKQDYRFATDAAGSLSLCTVYKNTRVFAP